MATDELTKPLGVGRRERRPRRRLPFGRAAGALAILLGAGLATYVALVDDPLGGEPHALAPIEIRPADAPAPEAPERRPGNVLEVPADAPRRTTATAGESESASGVSVVRPDGAAAPSSVFIRVPDAAPAAVRLGPAPDRRLVERTRHGVLPRIGPDGARPLDVYRRPAPAGGSAPRVAILVGGLGIGQGATADAIGRLPPAVTLAFAPYGSDLERHVARAREDGHEVMLQVPMEPFDYPDNDPGPHTLTVRAGREDNLDRLHWVMGRFPGYVGLVNFMGARLTADEAALTPVLQEVGRRGLGFLDDGSSSRSLVAGAAGRAGVAAARADLVLDGVPRGDAIDRELARLEGLARERGLAIGTATALPLTVERLARWARELEGRGIVLVPVSSALKEGGAPRQAARP